MFQGSYIVKKLFYINIALFILTLIGQNLLGIPVLNYLALYPMDSPNFSFHQIITSMFMHGGLLHILFNIFGLISLGPVVEDHLGSRKFLLFYFIMGIGAPLLHFLFSDIPIIGASGALYGVLLYFTLMNPNQNLSIFPFPFQFKAKNLVTFLMIVEVALALFVNDGIAHLAHIGGAITGAILYKINSRYDLDI